VSKNSYTETISIKRISFDEFDQFYDFFESNTRKLFPQYDPKAIEIMLKSDSRLELKKKLKKKQLSFFVGLVNDQVAASLIADFAPYGGISEFHWLMTDPKHQKKGLASSLLQFAEADLIDQGAHKVKLDADQRNLNFYQKRGYQIVGKIDEHYFGTEDYIMAKSLQKAKPENYLR